MINKIIQYYEESSFDFRKYAYPEDELSYLFDEWIPYYRMKLAICKAIAPDSILEIGVRYGYSAITFLNAMPNARYLGIDNDTTTYGGLSGAIEYAKVILKDYNAEIILSDSQTMVDFPGDHWDLIHIDGQQDGDGTFHDLELAIQKATWILVDGYFWSEENLLATSYFLKKYQNFIRSAILIPGYAGDFLINVKENPDKRKLKNAAIATEYNRNYFLHHSLGYDLFKQTNGKEIGSDLIVSYLLSEPKEGVRILDLGCGRGELSYALAKAGANVTGIDYSSDAIKIAETTHRKEIIGGHLSFICGDVATYKFTDTYDVIIANNFIEHLEPNVLECILKRSAELLNSGGKFIVHTTPNHLYFQNVYPELRRKVRDAGSWIPPNPRTYYEDLMHINEQTPESLKTTLDTIFKHSIVWAASNPDIVGSLGKEYSTTMLDTSKNIYSISSKSPLNKNEILSLITRTPLNKERISITMEPPSLIEDMIINTLYNLKVPLRNESNQNLVSLQPYPVYLAYHWKDKDGNMITYEGKRSPIFPPLKYGDSQLINMIIIPPSSSGKYILEITLVQEKCFWFEDVVKNLPYQVECHVRNRKGIQ